jgi:hypothetical protein
MGRAAGIAAAVRVVHAFGRGSDESASSGCRYRVSRSNGLRRHNKIGALGRPGNSVRVQQSRWQAHSADKDLVGIGTAALTQSIGAALWSNAWEGRRLVKSCALKLYGEEPGRKLPCKAIAAWFHRNTTKLVVASRPLYCPQNDEQDDRSDHRRYDGGDKTGADAEAQSAGEPATDQGTDNSHDNVAYEAEPAALDQHASEPTCDRTDDQPNDDALRAHSCLHSKLKGSATPFLESKE